MHGVGRTVFSGNNIEEFQVEILGVLDNYGAKESIILGRLSGGPLERTGVMQGMSGSPVYIDGKLVGAVAMAFPFAKEPIAGIRPIEDMIAPPTRLAAGAQPERAAIALADKDLFRVLKHPTPVTAAGAPMEPIATPLAFGGFTPATLDKFAPQLRALGLEPRQAVGSGGNIPAAMGNPADLKPGSMISVQLLSGDYSVGADGTVTHIDGDRVYAFGHHFLDVGTTALPFARSEVVALIPTLNASFKLSSAKEWMGAIQMDATTAVSGRLGVRPALVPFNITVTRNSKPVETYRMQMVNDPLLSPLLIQMAVFATIDRTERTVGASTIRVTGRADFQNAPAPVLIDDMFSSENGTATETALSAAIPVAYVMQNNVGDLRLNSVDIKIDSLEERRRVTIDSVSVSRQQVRPGESVDLNVVLTGEKGVESDRRLTYQVPEGAPAGPLYFTVSDAGTANLSDFRAVLLSTLHTPAQLIAAVNALHPNTSAYVRVWRANPAFQLEGAELPDPPASVALILGGTPTTAGISQSRNSKVANMEISLGDVVVSGSKTVQVEVKE
jgi:hypothetical protein